MTRFYPHISFVITCYNYGLYVGEAISSALAQTYARVEVIVIDDGSTDNSPEIISSFGDRVRSIRQSNKGSISAYNLGFSESAGDIVVFLDADDRVTPTLAQRVAELWYPECAKIQYELEIIDAGGSRLGRFFCNFPSSYDVQRVKVEFEAYGTYIWPVTTGNAYSRWFLQIVFPLGITLGPDGFLNTVAPLFGDIITCANPLAAYRLHGSNIWGSSNVTWSTRINFRINEFRILRQYALRNNITIPDGNLLDNEIVFINYRIIAKKLDQTYDDMELDTYWLLWWAGVRVFINRPGKFWLKFIHFFWLSLVVLLPRYAVECLIRLRTNRSQYRKKLNDLLKLSHRPKSTSASASK